MLELSCFLNSCNSIAWDQGCKQEVIMLVFTRATEFPSNYGLGILSSNKLGKVRSKDLSTHDRNCIHLKHSF